MAMEMDTTGRIVPPQWTVTDRRLFLEIAERKKREHCSCYALVGIGSQLFLRVNDNARAHLLKNAALHTSAETNGRDTQGDAVEESTA